MVHSIDYLRITKLENVEEDDSTYKEYKKHIDYFTLYPLDGHESPN